MYLHWREKIREFIALFQKRDKMTFFTRLRANRCGRNYRLHRVPFCSHQCGKWLRRGPFGLLPARLLCPGYSPGKMHWSELPCPPPGNLPNPRIKPESLCPLRWQAGSLPTEASVSPQGASVGNKAVVWEAVGQQDGRTVSE